MATYIQALKGIIGASVKLSALVNELAVDAVSDDAGKSAAAMAQLADGYYWLAGQHGTDATQVRTEGVRIRRAFAAVNHTVTFNKKSGTLTVFKMEQVKAGDEPDGAKPEGGEAINPGDDPTDNDAKRKARNDKAVIREAIKLASQDDSLRAYLMAEIAKLAKGVK